MKERLENLNTLKKIEVKMTKHKSIHYKPQFPYRTMEESEIIQKQNEIFSLETGDKFKTAPFYKIITVYSATLNYYEVFYKHEYGMITSYWTRSPKLAYLKVWFKVLLYGIWSSIKD